MTNEELVESIQAGNIDLLSELWVQMKALIGWHAARFYRQRQARCDLSGVTTDDLIREGYRGFQYAVKNYDPGRGCAFSTCLRLPLKSCFINATRANPRDDCLSLDAPISNADGGVSLMDTLADKNSGADFEAVDDGIVNSHVRAALDDCLSLLPADVRNVFVLRYYSGLTQKQDRQKDRAPYKPRSGAGKDGAEPAPL